MLAAAAVAVTLAGCVPMRWISADPASLTILKDSAVTCLLLDEPQWPLAAAVKQRGLLALALVHSNEEATRAGRLNIDGLVTEGPVTVESRVPVVPLTRRYQLRFDLPHAVVGTTQGVWPGLEIPKEGEADTAHAGPSKGPWIHTNTGFLRYIHAVHAGPFWMANRPPEGTEWDGTRYAAAIADAATAGARWVVSLDEAFAKRLLAGHKETIAGWQMIQLYLRFYANGEEWRDLRPFAELALVQDPSAGAFVTGNLLDMLAVLNTPVRAMQSRELTEAKLQGTKITVAVQPQSYTEEQRALLDAYSGRSGKMVITDKGMKPAFPPGDTFTFSHEIYKEIEKIWPELRMAIQRKNFGVRLFNVSSTLSYLLRNSDGSKVALHLVNYTGYPVESITAFVQGKYKSAQLLTPEGPPRKLEVYDTDEGTGVDIDQMNTAAIVVLRRD